MNNPVPKAKIKFCKFEDALAMQFTYLDNRFCDVFVSKSNSTRIVAPAHMWSRRSYIKEGHYFNLVIGQKRDAMFVLLTTPKPEKLLKRVIMTFKDFAKNCEAWEGEEAIEPISKEYEGGVVYVEV